MPAPGRVPDPIELDANPPENGSNTTPNSVEKLGPIVPVEPRENAADAAPKVNSATDEPSQPTGPELAAPNNASPRRLELMVSSPPRHQVEGGVTYKLRIVNNGSDQVENVVVESEFDESLVFPGREEKRVRRALGQMPPGAEKEMALTLYSEQIGSQCCRFSVVSDGKEIVWKEVCVEFEQRRLDARIVGPEKRTVGSRAEYIIKLLNTSAEDLENVRVVISHDAALVAKEGSAGAERKPGSMSWALGSLEPGEGLQLQAEFACSRAAGQSCLLVDVSADDLPAEQLESCLEIALVRGPIDLRVSDHSDLVSVGEETEYVVTLHNRTRMNMRPLELTCTVPDTFRVLGASLVVGKQRRKATYRADGQRLTFRTPAPMAPNATLAYRIRVKANATGEGTFRARLGQIGRHPPFEVVETTIVNP